MPSSRAKFAAAVLLAGVAVSGCSTVTKNEALPSGTQADALFPATYVEPSIYEIHPADVVTLRVFGEEALTREKLRVDDAGFVQLPLIGQFKLSGLTSAQASRQIADALGRRYLLNPQVDLVVNEVSPRYVTVEGEVNKPGVYEITPNTTLLSALARAESPTFTAKLKEVVVFRKQDGQQLVARFNVKDIRGGLSPDPVIRDGDIVMVGYSGGRGLWQDILKAAPIFNAFGQFSRRF